MPVVAGLPDIVPVLAACVAPLDAFRPGQGENPLASDAAVRGMTVGKTLPAAPSCSISAAAMTAGPGQAAIVVIDAQCCPQRAAVSIGRVLRGVALASTLLLGGTASVPRPAPVLWAWERAEMLDAIPPAFGVAAVVGFIRLENGTVAVARGRRFPLVLRDGAPPPLGVVHIEIDQTRPLLWTDALRAEVVGATLVFMRPYAAVQVDMEVRDSQRGALLDVLRGVRAGRPAGTTLSMTALASWCDTEHWLAAAPVDEIVPMLFRMGTGGTPLRARLAAGGDFGEPRCRTALGVATDTPVTIPPGRRVYVFNPRPWDAAAVAAVEQRVFR